jgi:tRNA(Ser,Leu) C12 N-acetylase TAN1
VARAGFDALPFNAVAIAKERASARAVARLASVGAFRATPYRRVLVGVLAGDASARLIEGWNAQPSAFEHVVRIIPLDRVVAFERDDVTEEVCCATTGAGARLANKSFHVRARLRGLKGRLERQTVERALGGYFLDLAEAAGAPARVTFSDPDYIVAIEVIGRRVGVGILGRDVRAVPLVRPR